MAHRVREEERQRLIAQIKEWNSNRLDLFELSLPDETLEFHGVMRFFYQDDGSKVATKCIRVASSATTRDVLNTLVEKFRPDMRMLSMPIYSLYEVHVNGEERKLDDQERPLYVQLNWGIDDREGRFLLKREGDKSGNLHGIAFNGGTEAVGGGFKRKLSKREKKEKKKREKEAKLRGKENNPDAGVAEKLYNELPETSFTRSISNPEAVMRKRRQLKLEKKLQEFKSRDGGPDTGGTLKIYGETLDPGVPYKTLLLSAFDSAAYVVKETLEKYGMEKEDPAAYCLIQVFIPADPEYHGTGRQERVLEDNECPLQLLLQLNPSKGTLIFHIQRREGLGGMGPDPKRKKNKKSGQIAPDAGYPQEPVPQEMLPYLMEVNPDGSVSSKPRAYRLQLDVTEVGGEQSQHPSGQYLQLFGPNIHPQHCVIAHVEGVVTVTPTSREAETYVDGQRIFETTMLRHGMSVRFGQRNFLRFCDPRAEEVMRKQQDRMDRSMQERMGPPSMYGQQGPQGQQALETSFDMEGHVHTSGMPNSQKPMHGGMEGPHGPAEPPYGGPPGYQAKPADNLLPASLDFREDGEDAFLAAVVGDINGNNVQFKLAPTYTLYMAARHYISKRASPAEKAQRISNFVNKLANMIQHTIEDGRTSAPLLSFWMANASELLHFFKQDRDISQCSLDTQDVLADAVEGAFSHLVRCMQEELQYCMGAFLDNSDEDLHDMDGDMNPPQSRYSRGRPVIGDVLHALSQAMALLRRCRVNAALTIQLFSKLFHFINMWLFNKLVLEPRLQLCSQLWGARLKRRLGKVSVWAEKQGLELAADCHLARIMQAAHLLQAPKGSADDIASISSTCFKLNSLQMRALLSHYIPGPGEPRIPHELINSVVSVAENTADELTRSDGRDVRLDEEPDLQLPFLLPEDGYSCDIVRGVPNGLGDFLDPLCQNGLCRISVHQQAPGTWTVYMTGDDPMTRSINDGGRSGTLPPGGPPGEPPVPGMPRKPEVVTIVFGKVNGSLGLSIVAAKGEGQDKRGIYIKSVVPGGGAAQDGRLQAGDQLLEVDGKNLVGLTQEKAAEFMTKTGQTVTLKVAKQGAIYHGLATLLSQPSPVLQRAAASGMSSPHRHPGPGQNTRERPKSEEASQYLDHRNGPGGDMGGRYGQQPQGMPDPRQRPLNQQINARSSPALAYNQQQQQPQPQDSYRDDPYNNMYQKSGPGGPWGYDQGESAMRSKSVTNLDRPEPGQPDPRHMASTSTLPRHFTKHQQPQPQTSQPGMERNRAISQPALNHQDDGSPGGPRNNNYENFPSKQQAPPAYRQDPYGAGQHQSHMDPRGQYVQDQDIRSAQSMGNLQDQYARPDKGPNRALSGDSISRVEDWRRQNELSQRGPDDTMTAPPGGGYGMQQLSSPHDRFGDVPRSHAGNQQYQQNFYKNTTPQPQENTNQQRHSMGGPVPPVKPKPPVAAKPAVAPKPSAGPQEVPRIQTDNTRSQPNFYDGRQPSPQEPKRGQQVSHYGPPDAPSLSPHAHTGQRERSPGARLDQYEKRNDSPDLPPPPEVPPELPPPPNEGRGYQEDLPPPPPPPANEYGRQMREEQEMMRRMGQLEIQNQKPGWPASSSYQPNQHPVSSSTSSQGPSSQQTGYPPPLLTYTQAGAYRPSSHPGYNPAASGVTPHSQSSYHNYQNFPQQSQSGQVRPGYQQQEWVDTQPAQAPAQQQLPQPPQSSAPQYPYQPRPAPASTGVSAPSSPAKQRLLADEVARMARENSPSSVWEREQRERKQQEEIKHNRELEISQLESKRYRTPDEDERLQRMKIDQEFQRRMEEQNNRDDDSDNEAPSKGARKALIKSMQDDMERKRLQRQAEQQQQEQASVIAERERRERQERRLQQFEQERKEQKQRERKRQERKEREIEENLRKQREQREREQREQEEQIRRQRQEEEQQREQQRLEAQRKRDEEKEQLRAMQAAQEAEDRKRSALTKEELELRRLDRHGRLSLGQPSPTDYQPHSQSRNQFAPPPPERTSSYDIANQGQYRAGSLPPGGQDASQSFNQASRSTSSTSLRPPVDVGPSKKSVSFNQTLATDIRDSRPHAVPPGGDPYNYPQQPVSSSYQSPPPQSGYQQQPPQTTYAYSGWNPANDQPQHSQYNPVSSAVPSSVPSSHQYAPRTPENAYNQPPTLVTGVDTPGVVGAQEVYRDPRDRIHAQKAATEAAKDPSPERISFRDKMRLFAKEIGENTPKERTTTSRAQRQIELHLNGR